jgi:antitoxin component YwqK of YwqJK toxin-antitoxin module
MSNWRIFGEKDGILLTTGKANGVFKTYDSEGNLLFVGKVTSSDAKPGIKPGTVFFADSLLIAGIDQIAKLEGDSTGIYSGKTLTEELNLFAGLVDGKPTSWVEGTGVIR